MRRRRSAWREALWELATCLFQLAVFLVVLATLNEVVLHFYAR